MPTKNPRINITFEKSTQNVLIHLAQHEHKSISGLAKELILEALDRREDRILSNIAKERDTKKSKTIEHDDAWK